MSEAQAHGLDALDRQLLNALQIRFPLEARPFARLARELGASEDEVLVRTRALRRAGLLRHIGGIFEAQALGYRTALAAFQVPPERLDDAGEAIAGDPGVGHCYARDAEYNLWATLACPAASVLGDQVERLAAVARAKKWLCLPALRLFKLGVFFDMERGVAAGIAAPARANARRLAGEDELAAEALQHDLPLEERPFARLAQEHGLAEGELLAAAQRLIETGVMRRYGAVLRHRSGGFGANIMLCLSLPSERVTEAGEALASLTAVTHCYERPPASDWPYNLYAMLHARSREGCEELAAQAIALARPEQNRLLFSTREYKKERVRYQAQARQYYPAFLDLRGKRCLVVGAGEVAARKARALVDAGARVEMVAPNACAEAKALAETGGSALRERAFVPDDVRGAFLVIAASDDPAVNAEAAGLARQAGALVNVVDDPEQCDFIVPSVVRRGGITFAVSTSGASPAMARWLRRRLEAEFPEHYAEVLQVVARVRDRLRREGVRVKSERWQEALDGELISLVARGDGAAAEERLLQMLGKAEEG